MFSRNEITQNKDTKQFAIEELNEIFRHDQTWNSTGILPHGVVAYVRDGQMS